MGHVKGLEKYECVSKKVCLSCDNTFVVGGRDGYGGGGCY